MAKTEMVTISKEELERLQRVATGGDSRAPGVYDLPPTPDRKGNVYDKAIRLRVLPNGSRIQWKISLGGWLSMTADLVVRKGHRPPAGVGGYANRWKAYGNYFRSKDYMADMAWAQANGVKDSPQ